MKRSFPRRTVAPAGPKLPDRLFVRECHVQQTVTEFLALDGWHPIRTELTIQRERGRVVGERGMPDYLYLRYDKRRDAAGRRSVNCEHMWLEFKRPGEKPNRDQVAWHQAASARGAFVLVVSDIDLFMSWYKSSGFYRRAIYEKPL